MKVKSKLTETNETLRRLDDWQVVYLLGVSSTFIKGILELTSPTS